MEMKKKSFVQTMNIMMWVQLIAVSILLILFTINIFRSAAKETNVVAKNFLEIYSTQIENRLEKIDMQLSTIVGEEEDMLLLGDADEAVRFYASNRLAEKMKAIMRLDQSADIFVVAQSENEICLDANNGNILLDDKEDVRKYFKKLAGNGSKYGQWQFGRIGEKNYLFRALNNQYRICAGIISVDSLLNTLPDVKFNNCAFVLTDHENYIQGYAGSHLFNEEKQIKNSQLELMDKFCNETILADGKMHLYSYAEKSETFRYLYGNAVWVLLIIILLVIFDFNFIRVEKKQLIMPMNAMVSDMKRMEAGDYEHRVSECGDTKEFFMLAKTFNKLMDEIIHLKIRFYEKKLALADAEQKYVRLQIRPHFFLNAMTTISSLSTKGKNKEIEIYISALSKNIRYMFSSGLHTVVVKEEIRHVENYFEMQELRYPDCLFYFISLPKELEEWKIPQMLIHTLIENEYKYAVSQDAVLVVLIKISKVLREGEEMLLIEVEDDGKGYPLEVLEYMNKDCYVEKQDGTRVGLWSIKRLLELMYDRKNLMELSNVQPHGAMNRIFIPEEPVNERSKDYLDERGIQ